MMSSRVLFAGSLGCCWAGKSFELPPVPVSRLLVSISALSPFSPANTAGRAVHTENERKRLGGINQQQEKGFKVL